jgi:zinc D-Ala-D-Ala dipeptidase
MLRIGPKSIACFWFFMALLACEPQTRAPQAQNPVAVPAKVARHEPAGPPANLPARYRDSIRALPDTAWVELVRLDPSFVLDIKYATADNFTKQVLYDCPRCFLRKKVAIDLLAAHEQVKKAGYRMKIFDGYRPLSVQWKMWHLTPSKKYVGNPRKGSMHNRGCAVDLTLIDAQGQELDMGSPYDFFGTTSHLDYPHPKAVASNRRVLQSAMTGHGFQLLKTEWWHFSHTRAYRISDFPIPCGN